MSSINKTSRRAILAGAAALPALAAPALATPYGIDPIFAAIEEHRAAFIGLLKAMTDGVEGDDDLIAEGPGYELASDRHVDAMNELANLKPSTIAGVVALIDYISQFNRGGLSVPHGRSGLSSEVYSWSDYLQAEDRQNKFGRPLTLPFAFWVLENVGDALKDMRLVG